MISIVPLPALPTGANLPESARRASSSASICSVIERRSTLRCVVAS